MRLFALMAVALASLLITPAGAADTADLAIRRGDGKTVTFDVELAADNESRARGLMFRKKLPASSGMLFLYDRPGRHAFWMKDTLIPLDMLFFDKTGELVYIHPSAQPHSLTAISPDRSDICAILEIGGGQAARRGLRVGDRMVLDRASPCLP